jgi:hypothetical protein
MLRRQVDKYTYKQVHKFIIVYLSTCFPVCFYKLFATIAVRSAVRQA